MSCHVATFAKDLGEVMSCRVATFARNLEIYDINICLNSGAIYAKPNSSYAHRVHQPGLTKPSFVNSGGVSGFGAQRVASGTPTDCH